MFGNILGTLQRFKKDDKSSRGSEAVCLIFPIPIAGSVLMHLKGKEEGRAVGEDSGEVEDRDQLASRDTREGEGIERVEDHDGFFRLCHQAQGSDGEFTSLTLASCVRAADRGS